MLRIIWTICGILKVASTIPDSRFQTIQEEHFVRCIKTIVYKHITPGQSIVISFLQLDYNNIRNQNTLDYNMSKSYYHLQFVDFLFENLHEPISWSLQISCPDNYNLNIGLHEEITRNGCYIILTWAWKTEIDMIVSIKYQISEIAMTQSWNNRALFIIAVIGELNKDSDKLIKIILDVLWIEYKILNSLVLLHSPLEEQNVIGIYTWVPFVGENYCHSLEEVVVLEKWIMEGNGKFMYDKKLFSEKITSVVKGCKLKVTIAFISSYAELFTYNSSANKTIHMLEGYDADVFAMILRVMNMTAEYDLQNLNYGISIHEKVSKLIEDLILWADAGFGGLAAHDLVGYFVDYTFQFADNNFKWYVQCPKKFSRLERILKIFSIQLSLTLIMTFIFGSLFLWIVALGYKTLKVGRTEHPSYTDNIICLCYFWSISVGVAIWKMPQSNGLRSFLITWIWCSFAISIVFQTYFTSFLVNPGFHKPIKTLEDLIKSPTDFGYDKVMDYVLNGTLTKAILQRHKMCTVYDDCFFRYLQGEFATLSSVFETKYMLTLLGENRPVCFLEENFCAKKSTIYLTKGSPFLERFNEIINQMWQSGLLIKIENDYLMRVRMRQVESRNISYEYKESDYDYYFVFSMSHLKICFYVISYGYCFSIIVFIFEIIFYNFRKCDIKK